MALPLRVPQSLLEDVYRIAGWKKVNGKWNGPRGAVTSNVESMTRLGVRFADAMRPDKLRWQQYALDKGMDINSQLPEVLLMAAREGLEQHEKKRK